MIKVSQKAVLLVNLGTPSEPTPRAVQQYLLEFLSDPYVVKLPAWLWKPLLYTVILPIRSKRSAKLYRSIWTEEGSPLAVYSKKLADKVQENLGDSFHIILSMRYGQPSIHAAIKSLVNGAIESLTILPLYPQHSVATTASCCDLVDRVFKQQGFDKLFPLRFISSYFDNGPYITALAETIRHYWVVHGTNAYLLFSFHGVPKRYTRLGDTYEQQCYTTVNLLAKALNLSPDRYQVVFQSRFGSAEWLQPYCDVLLRQLPAKKIKRVAILCPGFAVDCLETLEEISQRYRAIFLQAGGESFHYIPALNDSMAHSDLLARLIQQTTNEQRSQQLYSI